MVPTGFKTRQRRAFKGNGGGQVHRQRIDLLIVDAKLVMQMGPGGPAGLSHVADGVALVYPAALADAAGKAFEMPVGSGWLPLCRIITTLPYPPWLPANSICPSPVAGPGCRWGAVIDAFVGPAIAAGWVKAQGKTRGHPENSSGERRKALRRLFAFGGVVRPLPSWSNHRARWVCRCW